MSVSVIEHVWDRHGLQRNLQRNPSRSSQVLVRHQWTESSRSIASDEERICRLQGTRYVPVSGQGLPVPQPTVTLRPKAAEGSAKRSKQMDRAPGEDREREVSNE